VDLAPDKKYHPIPNVVGRDVSWQGLRSALYPYRDYPEVAQEIKEVERGKERRL
jgi:hypothetical protein